PLAPTPPAAGEARVAAPVAPAEDERRAPLIRKSAAQGEAATVAQTGAAKGLIVGEGTVADGENGIQPLAGLVDAVEDRASTSGRATRPRTANRLVVGEARVSDRGAAFIVQRAARSAEDHSPSGGTRTARCYVANEGAVEQGQ